MLAQTLLLVLPLAAAFSNPADHAAARARSRSRHASKHKKDVEDASAAALAKRDTYSGRATFYDVGLGACGWNNVASDYIVAQNSAQFGSSYPSPNCGKYITISYNGVTATAEIADECPTCDYGSLDLSRGLFDHFASEDLGEFQMTWWYNDGSGGSTTTSTSTYEAPTSTSTYQAPTSTYTPPTSTYTPTTTSSSTSTAAASTTSAPASSSSSSSVVSASATTTIIPDSVLSNSTVSYNSTSSAGDGSSSTTTEEGQKTVGNLVLLNQGVATFGNIVVLAASQ